jgi:polyhydroxyalkanoate synthase
MSRPRQNGDALLDALRVAFERAERGDPESSGPADPERSDVTATLLFAIDEASKALLWLRSKVAETASAGAHEAHASSSSPQQEARPSAIRGKGLLETLQLIIAQALQQPEILARHYAEFAREALEIFEHESGLAPERRDFRFKDSLWRESAFLRTLLQLYLAWCRSMQSWLEEQQLGPLDRKRVSFILEQLVAALAPSNLPINPAALRRAANTEGASVAAGLRHWIDDVLENRAMPRQIRADAYEVGKGLAATPGAVVFRNAQLELIQYAPQTPQVRHMPVLLTPPQINKYYVFDLRPQNSIIGHLIQSGLQMFVLSWRNPTKREAGWGLDTYIEAILEALDIICAITGSERLGLISACAGGFTATALIGYLAEIGDARIANHSLLVTCLFPNMGSDLELFVTPAVLERVRAFTQAHGIMEGKDLAKIFFWFRPNDLVWRYWVNNYLMGKDPPPLDVLYWDNDSTRLPAALHGDFCDMYERDVFQTPGALRVLGRGIDFAKTRVDSYFVGGREDYIMPWQGCYHAARLFRGEHEFVLSTSGHVQSILRPPRLANTIYYTNDDHRQPPERWLATAVRRDGSWWGHWHRWLNEKSGPLRPAPSTLGSPNHPPLMPAPGSYVRG